MATISFQLLLEMAPFPMTDNQIERMYPKGGCTIDAAHAEECVAKGVPVPYLISLLDSAAQLVLAKNWFLRGLGSETPEWSGTAMALLDTPEEESANDLVSSLSAQIQGLIQADIDADSNTVDTKSPAILIAQLGIELGRLSMIIDSSGDPADRAIQRAMVRLLSGMIEVEVRHRDQVREDLMKTAFEEILTAFAAA